MNLVNTKGEVNATPIYLTNETNRIPINNDVNVVHKYYATFLS